VLKQIVYFAECNRESYVRGATADYIVLTECRVATKNDVVFVNAQQTTKVTC